MCVVSLLYVSSLCLCLYLMSMTCLHHIHQDCGSSLCIPLCMSVSRCTSCLYRMCQVCVYHVIQTYNRVCVSCRYCRYRVYVCVYLMTMSSLYCIDPNFGLSLCMPLCMSVSRYTSCLYCVCQVWVYRVLIQTYNICVCRVTPPHKKHIQNNYTDDASSMHIHRHASYHLCIFI